MLKHNKCLQCSDILLCFSLSSLAAQYAKNISPGPCFLNWDKSPFVSGQLIGDACPETSVRYHNYSLRNNPEESSSLLFLLNHHHHKRQGLGPLARSVSRVTAAPSSSSLVFQFSSFLVGCSGMLSSGFGFVAFFVGVRTISLCIRLACRGCLLSAVRGG